jgi:hypothetical protein
MQPVDRDLAAIADLRTIVLYEMGHRFDHPEPRD